MDAQGEQVVAPQDNKAVARRYFEAADRQDLATLDSLIGPNHVLHFLGRPPMDWPAHKQLMRKVYSAFPDLRHTIEDQISEGDTVVSRVTLAGTHLGDWMGHKPTGRSIAITEMVIQKVVDGKIADEWTLQDQRTLMEQIGALEAPNE